MKTLLLLLLLGNLALAGCEFVAGAATGALATGAGYEINAKRRWTGSMTITTTSA